MGPRLTLPVLAATAALCATIPSHAADGWIVKSSDRSVAATASQLIDMIDAGPAKVVATIDHQASAERAGMKMGPATVIIFGNPALGTPLMQANPETAFDLPVRILVWEDGGQTRVAYLDPATIKQRYQLQGDSADTALAKMTKALDMLTTKATMAR